MPVKFTKFKWRDAVTPTTSEPYRVPASKAVDYIDWNALRMAAEKVRHIPCAVGEQYTLGGSHMIREIVFDDDVHWIARVRMARANKNAAEYYIPKQVHDFWTDALAAEMQSEIDTMSYVRERTDIPVPQVYSYDTTATNPVGAPFMLMECFVGTLGIEMPDSFQAIPDQFKQKYSDAEAAILVKLWELKFDKIGSIFKNKETGKYDVGPLTHGLGGPYSTAAEYYRAWTAHNKSIPGVTSDFISRIERVSPLISKHNDGPFRLVHPHFGHQNVIVDDDFNILAVISWQKSFVGPAEMTATFPMRLSMYPEALLPRVRDEDGKLVDEYDRRTIEHREVFLAAVESQEEKLLVSQRVSTNMTGPTADVLFLIRRWEARNPWLYNYEPGVEKGVSAVLNNLTYRN